MRFRRLLLSLVVALSFVGAPLLTSAAAAQKKTVHVKEYTKKDGTKVEAHDRKAPEPKSEKAAESKPKKDPAVTPASSTSDGTLPPRDAKGRFVRSESAKHQFEVQTGYPHGRPGYVVDHIRPLACGGADAPSNMQWQTIAEAKAKDKTERIGCR